MFSEELSTKAMLFYVLYGISFNLKKDQKNRPHDYEG